MSFILRPFNSNSSKNEDVEEEIITPSGKVAKKLKKSFPNIGDEDLKQYSDVLSNPKKLLHTYFSKEQLYQHAFISKDSKLTLKFIITEIYTSPLQKGFREVLSPVLSTSNLSPDFGMFHCALLIGPWYFEWNDSSLCIPRTCSSNHALFVTDVLSVSIKKDLRDVLEVMCSMIVDWNIKREYTVIPGKLQELKGNCQEFVDSILTSLDISLNFEKTCIGLYLDKMRKEGKGGFLFETKEKEVIELMGGEGKKEFTSHMELDYFLQCILEKEPTFSFKFESEFCLLKCFDRAFWLRHAKKPNDEKYHCLTRKGRCTCPFGDPESTNSILYKN